MKKVMVLAIIMIVTSGAAFANDISGVWRLQSSKTNGVDYLTVKMERCGNAYCAKVHQAIGMDGKPVSSYPHLGKTMIRNMVHQGGGVFKGGTVWDPRRNRTFPLEMQVRGQRARAKVCASAVLCRKFEWRKIR